MRQSYEASCRFIYLLSEILTLRCVCATHSSEHGHEDENRGDEDSYDDDDDDSETGRVLSHTVQGGQE